MHYRIIYTYKFLKTERFVFLAIWSFGFSEYWLFKYIIFIISQLYILLHNYFTFTLFNYNLDQIFERKYLEFRMLQYHFSLSLINCLKSSQKYLPAYIAVLDCIFCQNPNKTFITPVYTYKLIWWSICVLNIGLPAVISMLWWGSFTSSRLLINSSDIHKHT